MTHSMRAADVMPPNVTTITDTTATEAAIRIMLDKRVSGGPSWTGPARWSIPGHVRTDASLADVFLAGNAWFDHWSGHERRPRPATARLAEPLHRWPLAQHRGPRLLDWAAHAANAPFQTAELLQYSFTQ